MRKKKSFNPVLGTVLAFVLLITTIVLVVVLSSHREMQEQKEMQEKKDQSIPTTAIPSPSVSPRPHEDHYDAARDTENENHMLTADGTYDNTQILSVESWVGMTLYIGTGGSADNALYINPHFVYERAGNPNEQYGYLLQTNRIPLEYADTVPASASDIKNAAETDLAILGRTYDKVVPAATKDAQKFGVRWKDSPSIGGKDHDGDTLHILTIRLSDGTLMCAAQVEIIYDEVAGQYRFESFRNNDVKYTGALNGEQREMLVQSALDVIESGNNNFALNLGNDNIEYIKSITIVEKVQKTYWNRLFNAAGDTIVRGSLLQNEMYAVDLNIAGLGFFTIYYMPEPMAHGINTQMYGYQNKINYVPAAYDAFAPMTVSIFNSYLTEEDARFFGAEKY